MSSQRVIVIGGGAVGFLAAITCAETDPQADVTVLERGKQFLTKAKISGGGRCHVTHACFDAREFATRFPRGERELIGPLKRFEASNMVAWLSAHVINANLAAQLGVGAYR
jgi:predicted flavoprotein YhiN